MIHANSPAIEITERKRVRKGTWVVSDTGAIM
jgi:hypothetical protein